MPPFKKFKSYTGLHITEEKLIMLLSAYELTSCENVLKFWFGVEDLAAVQTPEVMPSAG